jgi:hypothetical protein
MTDDRQGAESPLGQHPVELAFEPPEARHFCVQRQRHRGAGHGSVEVKGEPEPERLWGSAVTRIEMARGRWWAHNEEYSTEISICPWCGIDLQQLASRDIEDKAPHPAGSWANRVDVDLGVWQGVKETVGELEPGSQVLLHAQFHVLVIVEQDPEGEELYRRIDALRLALAGVARDVEVHLMGREVYERTKNVPGTLACWLAWRGAPERMDMLVHNLVEHGTADSEVSVRARKLKMTDRDLVVELEDGSTRSVPIALFPILADATPEERQEFVTVGNGVGFHWPELDEDVSAFSMVYPERTMAMRPDAVLRIIQRNRAKRNQSATKGDHG